MNLIKKIAGICLLISISVTVFAATDLDTLEQNLKSDINKLMQTTEVKLQEISLEAIDSFYIPPTNVLNKEISNLPDFLNSKYIDLAGGKYSIGGVSGTKPGIYNNTLRVFNERSERLVTESINSFNDLPSIREISKDVNNQEVVSQAREDFLSMLSAIKSNIYLNIVDAKDYILQDVRSYIDNLISNYTAEKARQLGAPVVYSEPMVQKSFWDNVKTLTTGWWKEFKKEAFTSHIDPETGECLTAKNPLAKEGEENQFNITPFNSKETKTTVCRSFFDQLSATSKNITTNITTKLKEGVVEVAGATAQAIGQGVKEVPGKISDAINKPRETEEKPQSSTSTDDLLLKAAQSTSFNKKSIDDILAKNPNINVQDKNGNTPLILAFDNDNYELAAYLLEQDDINTTIQNKQSETALFALTKSYAREEAKVRHDLSKKANLDEQIDPIVMMLQDSVNIPNNQGKTPLMQAAQNDNSYLVTLLIDNGANATIKDKNGKTAYNYSEGKPLTISALNQSGDVQLPDANAKDNDGNTALIRAFNNDDYGSAKYLLNQPNIDIIDQNKQGETALFALVKSYAREEAKVRHDLSKKSNLDEQMEQFVIKLKKSINIADKQGRTPLIQAAQNDNSYLVTVLLENGADINLKDKNGKSAIDYAQGKPLTTDVLNQGKPVEIDVAALNMSLLAEVMKKDPNINTIKELVDQGADINMKDAKGNPLLLVPLILQPRKENVALELLKLKANPNAANSSKFTPLMEQARKEYFQQGYSDITVDKALIDRGANVNAFDSAHKSALLYAAQSYNLPSMKLLLESGADPDARNTENENALNLIAKWYLNQKETFVKQSRTSVFDKLVTDIVDLLIRYKINVNNQAKDSTTPLMLFAAAGDGKVVEKLLQAGAQLEAKDSRGQKAVDYAKPGSTAEGILKAYYL